MQGVNEAIVAEKGTHYHPASIYRRCVAGTRPGRQEPATLLPDRSSQFFRMLPAALLYFDRTSSE